MHERLRIIWGAEPNYRKDCRALRIQADTHLRTLRARRDVPDDRPYNEAFTIPFGRTQAEAKIESANSDSATIAVTQHESSETMFYALNALADELLLKVGEAGSWRRVGDSLEDYHETMQLATALFDCNDMAMLLPPTPPDF